MTSRICFVLIGFIALTGCYTQIRQPGVQRPERIESLVPLSLPTVSVQRFEYYNQNLYYDYCDPFRSRSVPVYTSCFPQPFTRYPAWRQDRLIWEYAYWATVYDPWWRGCPPRVLVPRVVYASLPRDYEDEREDLVARPNPRPNVRHGGTSGPPAPASTIRTGGTSTTTQPKGTSSSPKTQPPPKKKDEEEKREEKRTERKRRGGMR